MPRPVHRDQARRFGRGVLAIAVLGVIAWVGITVQGGGELPGKDYTYVQASFTDVGMLKTRQDVTQNGVRIGDVDDVTYRDGTALVTMRLDGDRAVYRDAHATVGNESALGRKQIRLDPGTPAAGLLGNTPIPLSQTTPSTAIDDPLSVFDEQTRQALSSSLIELGGGLTGHNGDLHDFLQTAPAVLDDTGKISGALSGPQADLPGLLDSATRLAGRFDGRQQELTALVEQTDATLRAVNVDGAAPLNDTLRELPDTLRQARAGLSALDGPLADTQAALATVRPGAQALGSATGDLRGVLREAVPPLRKTPGVAEHANPAVDSLTHTLADARPLVPHLATALADARVLLQGLAPYATDIGRFFSENDLLSGQIAPDKNYFSLTLAMPGLYTASLPDPAVHTVPYPAPGGGAWRDNQGGR